MLPGVLLIRETPARRRAGARVAGRMTSGAIRAPLLGAKPGLFQPVRKRRKLPAQVSRQSYVGRAHREPDLASALLHAHRDLLRAPLQFERDVARRCPRRFLFRPSGNV